jgi:response regulator RpfG family c-di-GMP phosphodiesterase
MCTGFSRTAPKRKTNFILEIVDRSCASGYRLRNSLSDSDVTVHVFNAWPAALAMIHRKKIDTVVVEFDTDKDTVDFCNTVKG